MGSMWTCADRDEPLQSSDYEEIYIHAKVAVVDDAAFTIGSTNLNLRSMAIDSELNILSEAKDVAFELRTDLFRQCTCDPGPAQFEDMSKCFSVWNDLALQNKKSMAAGRAYKNQVLPFYVERKPGSTVV
ncbi:PLD-like domain-containing protein [Duganella sp. CF517]|nr:PLD-like domain-containing protein [Duganella sp. CF517]